MSRVCFYSHLNIKNRANEIGEGEVCVAGSNTTPSSFSSWLTLLSFDRHWHVTQQLLPSSWIFSPLWGHGSPIGPGLWRHTDNRQGRGRSSRPHVLRRRESATAHAPTNVIGKHWRYLTLLKSISISFRKCSAAVSLWLISQTVCRTRAPKNRQLKKSS